MLDVIREQPGGKFKAIDDSIFQGASIEQDSESRAKTIMDFKDAWNHKTGSHLRVNDILEAPTIAAINAAVHLKQSAHDVEMTQSAPPKVTPAIAIAVPKLSKS
jgi:hypothetical protein